MKKRKNPSADFKAKVALEAIREEMTLAGLSKKYGVHANQISTWKRAAIENMASAFTRRGAAPEQMSGAKIEKLHLKIGNWWLSGIFWPMPPFSCSGRGPIVTLPLARHCRSVGQKMVSRDHKLSVRRQCTLLTLTRSNLYYDP